MVLFVKLFLLYDLSYFWSSITTITKTHFFSKKINGFGVGTCTVTGRCSTLNMHHKYNARPICVSRGLGAGGGEGTGRGYGCPGNLTHCVVFPMELEEYCVAYATPPCLPPLLVTNESRAAPPPHPLPWLYDASENTDTQVPIPGATTLTMRTQMAISKGMAGMYL